MGEVRKSNLPRRDNHRRRPSAAAVMLRLNRLLPLVRAASQLPSPIHHSDCLRLVSNSPAPSPSRTTSSPPAASPQPRPAAHPRRRSPRRPECPKALDDFTCARHRTRFDPESPTPSSPCYPAPASPAPTSPTSSPPTRCSSAHGWTGSGPASATSATALGSPFPRSPASSRPAAPG